MTFHVRKDARGEWRWNLTAANGKKIAASGEGYKDKKDCLHAIPHLPPAATAGAVLSMMRLRTGSAASRRRRE